MKSLFTLFSITFMWFVSLGQTPIEVTDMTLKIPPVGEETMYYAFAEGDQIVFNFQEIDNKELKEMEILEYPSTSKFMDFKATKVQDKRIQVMRTGIYKFRFSNGHLISNRICKVKIERIPASEATKNFNTAIKWEVLADTTWNTYTKDVLVGYDTLLQQKTRRVLVKADSTEELILDKSQKVHSTTNENGNRSSLFFSLPQNIDTHLEEKRVVAWAYWIGVGEESNVAWQKNSQAITKAVSGAASIYMTPIGGIAAGLVTSLLLPTSGEDIIYSLLDEANLRLKNNNYQYRVYDQGKGIASYKRFTQTGIQQGKFHVLLENDNFMVGIDVNVKVSAIVEQKTFKDEEYTDQKVTPKYEKQVMRDPIIKNRKEPVMMQ